MYGFLLKLIDFPYFSNHGNASQLLGNLALHDPLESLLHLYDVILVEHQTLRPERITTVLIKPNSK